MLNIMFLFSKPNSLGLVDDEITFIAYRKTSNNRPPPLEPLRKNKRPPPIIDPRPSLLYTAALHNYDKFDKMIPL